MIYIKPEVWEAIWITIRWPALVVLGLLLLCCLLVSTPASSHDEWISRGGHRGVGPNAGEWCCGEGDCFVIPSEEVGVNGVGYVLWGGKEVVPFAEAQPSPDGAFWRCKRPDGVRRCFFAPPPAT